MVRNNLITPDTKIYKFLNDLKGTWYKNSFSSYPDTGRAIGAFLTGQKAFINGCDNRVKYPRFFLKEKTLFDVFEEKGYKIDIFAHQHHIIPNKFIPKSKFDSSLNDFLNSIEIEDNHLIFMDIQTFHSILDNCGYTTKGFKKANKELVLDLNIVFQHLNVGLFDDIYIFSDHGFKFTYQMIYQKILKKKYLLLNEDRTNILFFHHKNGDDKLKFNNSLLSIKDLFYFITNKKLNNREFVVIEDHLNFSQAYIPIEIWGVVTLNEIYIRMYNKAILLNRNSKNEKQCIIQKYDKILLKESITFRENYQIEQAKNTSNSKNLCARSAKKYECNKSNLDVFIDLIKTLREVI